MKTALVTIIMFLIMISIHEFGHFIVAKLTGIKVLEFAIGMGPAIFKKQKGETLYSLRILPIGGYCSMEGEEKSSDDTRAFCNQALWKRFLVVVAGAVLNVLLGFLIFIIIVSSGKDFPTNKINIVDPFSYFAQTGVRKGDEIIDINGNKINFYPDISMYTSKLNSSDSINVTIKRGHEKILYSVKPSIEKTKIVYQQDAIQSQININGNIQNKIIPYSDDTPRDDALIGTTKTNERYIIGFTPEFIKPNVLNVITQAGHYTVFVVKLVYKAFFDMITGVIGLNQLSGPVGVVNEVNTAVNSGRYSILNVLNLVGLLTINLGIFNLLPIPALDGGRLFFMLVEAIRRKPIPAEKENTVHAIGFVLLMVLILVVTFNDVWKLIFR